MKKCTTIDAMKNSQKIKEAFFILQNNQDLFKNITLNNVFDDIKLFNKCLNYIRTSIKENQNEFTDISLEQVEGIRESFYIEKCDNSEIDISNYLQKADQTFKNNIIGFNSIQYKDKQYDYALIDKELEPKLPGFLGFPKGQFLFISEEVPSEYIDFQLTHEIIEFTELKGQLHRCKHSLLEELKLVPKDLKKKYIEYRKTFFTNLVEYYKNSKDEDFKKEIQQTLTTLTEISSE